MWAGFVAFFMIYYNINNTKQCQYTLNNTTLSDYDTTTHKMTVGLIAFIIVFYSIYNIMCSCKKILWFYFFYVFFSYKN